MQITRIQVIYTAPSWLSREEPVTAESGLERVSGDVLNLSVEYLMITVPPLRVGPASLSRPVTQPSGCHGEPCILLARYANRPVSLEPSLINVIRDRSR
jgi:hypothetical protein